MNHSREVVVFSDNVLHKVVLVGPSMNLEARVAISPPDLDLLIAQSEGVVVRGQKTPVHDLVVFDAARGGKAADITFATGRHHLLPLRGPVSEVTAGSAANIANALLEFGGGDIGIISAVGRGGGREGLLHSLAERGLTECILFRRPGGTARSLILYEPNGVATVLAKKPSYTVSPETLATLREQISASVQVVVCTGFLEYELPLVEALLTAPAVSEARILSPHVGCFATHQGREHCLRLAAQADLFHVNQFELGRMLGYDDAWTLPKDDREIAALGQRVGSRIVCITASASGSVIYDRRRNLVIRQVAHSPQEIHNVLGAGDVHLSALIWYLWLRRKRLDITGALEVAARVCGAKIGWRAGQNAELPRPWEGIPDSATRKPWARAHYPASPEG